MRCQASALPSAQLKATLVERFTNAINVPGDGAVFAWAQVVVDFVSRNPPLDSIFRFSVSLLMPSSLAAAGVGFHCIGIQSRTLIALRQVATCQLEGIPTNIETFAVLQKKAAAFVFRSHASPKL